MPAAYTTPSPVLNTAVVSATTPDPTPGNNSSTSSTPVAPSADVQVVKTGPASIVPGTSAVFTIVVTNNGASDAAAVSVADPSPAGLTFVSNAGACLVAYPCPLALVPAGATRTITSTYSVPSSYTAPDPVLNTATVSSTTPDPTPGNNTSTSSSPLARQADLAITNDDGTLVYVAGGHLTYTVTVSNFGPSDVVGGNVSNLFPPQLQNIAWTCAGSAGTSCSAAGTGDINDLVTIPSGGSVTYVITVDVLAGASVNPLTTTATATTPVGVTDPTPANNTASDSDSPTAAPSSIGDRLWLDENGNGVQDAGEDGLAGVTVGLYDSTGTVLITATTTDSQGRYVFSGLPAGDFVVRVDSSTLPAGLAANPTYDLDSGTTGPDGQTAITVAAGVHDDTADFGFNWVSPTSSVNPGPGATGAIGDRIWNDANGNGVQDAGEAGIAGVAVRLLTDDNGDGVYGGAGDNAAATATTNASGHYIFDGVAPGSYQVQVDTTTLPTGFSTTPSGDPDSDGDNTSNTVVLAPGDVWVNGDFGYQLPTGLSIGSSIYLDANANGVQDAGEPGIAGVTITLFDNAGKVITSTTTDALGGYVFAGLPEGTYSVVVTDTAGVLTDASANTGDPDGGFDRISTVVLVGADNLDQNFGFAPAGHDPGDGLIGDSVFLDRNGNGIADPGEGIAGVAVGLFDATGTTLVATVVTDRNGQYVFGGLDATRTYVIRVDTTTLPGGGLALTNTVDPDGATFDEATVDLTTFVGGTTTDIDFGYMANTPNIISGTVWNDADGNGTLGASETAGYAGVLIVLRDSSGNIVSTTTTDAAGNYQFLGLPEGTYSVEVVDTANVLGGLWKSTGTSPGTDGNSQANGYTVTVGAGSTDTTADFGFFGGGGASLGNRVFSDTNNDGMQDVSEIGIASVVVTLRITYPSGDTVTLRTTTDASGAYWFGNLMFDENFDGAGLGEPTFVLSVGTPASQQPSPTGVGTDRRIDSNDHNGSTAIAARGATSTTDDSLLSNSYDFGFTPITDVAVVITPPAQAVPGTNAVFTITVTNNGPFTAKASQVGNLTPPGLTLVSTAGDCASAFPCSLGDLAPGATRTITVTYAVPPSYTTPDPIVATATTSTTTVESILANNSSNASVSVVPSADVSVLKVGPGAVTPGNNLVYTLLVTNNGPSNAVGVSLSDPTPSGLTFVSNSGDCTTTFPCSLGTLTPGATRMITATFSVPLLYTAPAPVVNTAVVSAITNDPVPGNNTSAASTTLSAVLADLGVVKTGPATATPGSTVTWTVTVTNNGPSAAASSMVTDPTPGGLIFVSNTGGCTTAYPCALGTLANGATRTITSTYSVPASYTSPNPISNTAIVSSAASDSNPANDSSTASASLSPSADVAVLKTGPASIVPGGNAVYSITVTNNGVSDAAAVSVADPTPAGLTFVSNAGNCATAWPCALGTIAAGGTRTITSTYLVPASYTTPSSVVNTATATSTTPDPVPGNNSSSTSAPVSASADVAIVKTAPASITPGGNAVFTVTVSNNGASDAAAVVVSDTTPTGLTFVSNSGGCTTAYPCSLGTLPAGQTRTITSTYSVPVSYTSPVPVVNTATVTSSTPDPVSGNNTASASASIAGSSIDQDLSITKGHTGTFTTCGTGIYTLQVHNLGTTASTGQTVVSDVLPFSLTYVSATGSGWNCTAAGQAVSCTSGSSIPARGVSTPITLTVTIDKTAFPTVNNTASVHGTNDLNPVNNMTTHGVTVRKGTNCGQAEDCAVSLRKTHVGTAEIGSQVLYNLQWSNSCRGDLSDVTVSDPLPAGLQLVTATSADATPTITGNSISFHMATFRAGSVAQASITATIVAPATAGSTIENVATISDPAGHTGQANDPMRVREAGAGDCKVTLRKVHSGNNNPGGEIQYTLQWSSTCRDDLTNVVVSDPMPAGLTLLTATSSDATATVLGNTATFRVATLAAQTVGQGFITARIDAAAEPGASVLNVATISDTAGHQATANNIFRIRGGSTDADRISCFVRAQVYARPGRYVKYEVRYKNGGDNNRLSLTMPDELTLDQIYPAPTRIEGNTIEWDNLARTSGKVTVNTFVKQSAEDGLVLPSSAILDDGAGNVGICEHTGVVNRYEKLFASIKAQSISRAGSSIRYTARYREAVGSNTMTMSLPNEISIVRISPPPTSSSDHTLIWRDLALPSGSVKIDGVVGNVPNGTVLVASMTMTDDSTDIVGAEHQTVVSSTTGTGGGVGGALALGMSMLRSVSAGATTDITLRFEGLDAPGSVLVELPSELVPVLTVPTAAISGNTVLWSGLTDSLGSMKVRVQVDPSASPAKTLIVHASAMGSSGATALATASTIVRIDSAPAPELSMDLTLTRTVTKGTTTDISASYQGLQGTGHLTLTLPVGMTLQSTVPAGAQVVGSDLTWNGLSDASGSLRARVLVSGAAVSASTLAVNGAVGDSSGANASAAGTTSVR